MGLTDAEIQAALPVGGLFAGKHWLTSPEPLKISKREGRDIKRLGRCLTSFQEACERIYRRSAKGVEGTNHTGNDFHPWLAELIDAGKPNWLIDAQRSSELHDHRPRVIRPDLLLTEKGMAIAELDAVPGGIGLTAWLADLYGEAGFELLGAEQGMKSGFRSLFPEEGGRILISEESGDYRPEMEWLTDQLEGLSVHPAENATGSEEGALYRFFELFDWENIPAAQKLAKNPQLSPPCKPLHEEKLWLALLWCPALRGVWEEELRGRHLDTLRQLVPFGWVLDPTELPPHAALPKLGVQSWHEVGKMSQKERRLVLKISGFNERAWGSRGVVIGHDEPGEKWAQSIESALADSPKSPWLMQDFADGRLVEHPYYDRETGEEKIMKGRVRLCPYYFRPLSGGVELGGCLATIVPADKKKIHGMEDAILVPVCVES